MSVDEIRRRLAAMGFAQVDDKPGWRRDFKWRHRSDSEGRHGSVWVHPTVVVVRATGAPPRGYGFKLRTWARPTRIERDLNPPLPVWEGKDLARLLDEMEKRITPATKWPKP